MNTENFAHSFEICNSVCPLVRECGRSHIHFANHKVLEYRVFSFKPKTGLNKESWWLDFESDSTESIFFKSAGEPKKVSHYDFYKLTCKVKGKISKPGHYGHMNMYKRKIIIESILEVIQ